MSTAMASLVLAVFVLPSATAASVTTAGGNCSSCGSSTPIPYPFGIGPSCSLPGFNLTCDVLADNSTVFLLGNPDNRVQVSGQVQRPISFRGTLDIYNLSFSLKMIPGVRDYSVHWEAPAPLVISGSSNMSMFVVGCGLKASLFNGDSGVEVGNCFVTCAEAQFREKLPLGPCVGIGCCLVDIQVNLRSFTLNISRIIDSPRSEQVHAFITAGYTTFRPGDVLKSAWLDQYISTLYWAIPYQPNCKRAMEDRASYACVSKHSKCQDSPIGGYLCHCESSSDENAYVVDGCSDPPVYDSIQPRRDCPTLCGNVSIPFPFGTEPGCFAELRFYLACTPRPVPVPELSDGTLVNNISIDDGVLHVYKASRPIEFLSALDLDTVFYAFSGEGGVVRWVIDNTTCEQAKLDKSEYRCFSSNSGCLDVTDGTLKHVGYRCKCSAGFEGNPYIKDGCADINECLQPDNYICNGVCRNSFGSYTCTGCPRGTEFSDITRKCKPSTIILGVSIGVSSGGGILFLGIIAAVLTRRWKRGVQKRLRRRYFLKNKGILLEQLISSDNNSASDGTKIFSLEELEKATNNFDHARVVGRGGHGTVYKGILTDQRVVAIKKSTAAVVSEIDEFINEVSILSQVNHRNVVKLHGCCLESEVPLLVYEFVSNGTLYDLLHGELNGVLPWEERLRIATEIAAVLTYLHSAASVPVLHRDVKCMNVLLNDSYTVKVSDFGASRLIPIDQTHLVTAVQGTFGYLDPEYYHTGQLNEKSDVYSFGVILAELLTRRKPIIQNEHGEKQNLSNYFLWAIGEGLLEETVDARILDEGSEEGILSMARLAEECLSLTRGERPTMKDVEMRLQLLTGRRVAPWARRDEEVTRRRRQGAEDKRRDGVGPVIAHHHHGHGHGSRQYSQEQEFVSSLRVPR